MSNVEERARAVWKEARSLPAEEEVAAQVFALEELGENPGAAEDCAACHHCWEKQEEEK